MDIHETKYVCSAYVPVDLCGELKLQLVLKCCHFFLLNIDKTVIMNQFE